MDTSFDSSKSSSLSDVVLVAEDAEGNKQELHASRTYLSVFSSFFERMFFSEFKEANSNSIEVSCSYEVMKLILDIIYGLGRDYSKVKQTYDIDVLMELYKAADFLDFPFVRGLCIEQMLDRPSVEMATAILRLSATYTAVRDTLIEILRKLSTEDLRKFLSTDDSRLVFSKNDTILVYDRLARKPLPSSKSVSSECICGKELYDLYEKIDSPLIDYTVKWTWSDVLFRTKNSNGKELYSSKTVLSMVSPHFAVMFSSREDSNNVEITEIELDVEYIIMKNILCIVHQCYNHGSLDCYSWRHLFMVYLMYCAAAENKLDIPKIRQFCAKSLQDYIQIGTTWFQFEISTRLTEAKPFVLEKIEAAELLQWVRRVGKNSDEVYYMKDEKYHMGYVYIDKPILSISDVRIVIDKLLAEYNK